MRIRKIIIFTLILFTGIALAAGLAIKVKFKLVAAHFDPQFVKGKFYRRPIHPGFITQRHPILSARIVKSSGPLQSGLPTARQFEKAE